MNEERRFERFTWKDVEAEVKANTPIALPVGSVEAHGPHLPLGTDAFIPHRTLLRLAERRRVLVAPPVMYAAYSRPRIGGGRTFPGSTGVPLSVLEQTVAAIVADWMRQGFCKVLVLNGHYENSLALMEALEQASAPYLETHRVALVNWWEQLTQSDIHDIFGDDFPGWEAEHASITETSLMEALWPEQVRADLKMDGGAPRRISYDVYPTPADTIWPTGIGNSAVAASAELGEKLVDLLLQRLEEIIDTELGGAS
jgi:creatinine amidohydrolase